MLLAHQHVWSEGRAASEDELLLCHTAEHVELIRGRRGPVWLDGDTLCTATTYEAATPRGGHGDRGCAARRLRARPAAGPPRARGARDGLLHLQQRRRRGTRRTGELGLERVAIIDFDVHHGNGTEAIFRDDDSVLFVSLHQWPFYPGSGGPDDQAETTLNVPLLRVGRRGVPRRFRPHRRARGHARSRPSSCSSRPASTRTRTTRSPTCA